MHSPSDHTTPPTPTATLLSIVVIGYNEANGLGACLKSVQAVELGPCKIEAIYVDGGSRDDSVRIAQEAGVRVIESEGKQRRAAENRNVGWRASAGEFVQFVDGDMVLDPDWPQAALDVLNRHDDGAVVFGRLQERNQNAFYQALEIDWRYPEGPALYCGGAAMFRRKALEEVGGFPEDVAYGEEPLLCWRIRNELGQKIYHSHHLMAHHDLAYRGFGDYMRRNVRVGETYAEIEARCRHTQDPFWQQESKTTLWWASALSGCILLSVLLLPRPWAVLPLYIPILLVLRKAFQGWRQGASMKVALVYGLHTYVSKLGAGWGIVRWRIRHRSAVKRRA